MLSADAAAQACDPGTWDARSLTAGAKEWDPVSKNNLKKDEYSDASHLYSQNETGRLDAEFKTSLGYSETKSQKEKKNRRHT